MGLSLSFRRHQPTHLATASLRALRASEQVARQWRALALHHEALALAWKGRFELLYETATPTQVAMLRTLDDLDGLDVAEKPA